MASAVPATVTIAGKKFQILFGANALRRLEKVSGYSVTAIGLMLVSGRGGYGLLQEAIWAGMEGARLKLNPQQPELSVEEVGDLIDDHDGGIVALCHSESEFTARFMEAWESAFPTMRKDAPKTDPPTAADAPSQAPTSGGTT